MPADASAILKRYNKLVERRRLWETEWRDLAKYIFPRKQQALTGNAPGQRQTIGLYDGTAIKANEDLAATMQGTLTSPAMRWFSLRMRRKDLNDQREVGAWLDECADRMYLALQQSNFEAEMYEVYLDLGAFGVAALLLEESEIVRAGFNGFRFRAYTVGEYVIGEDAYGRANAFYHHLLIPGQAALERFGAGLSDAAKQKAAQDPDCDLGFLHAIYRREGGSAERGTPVSNLPWASVYVEVHDPTRKGTLGTGTQSAAEEGGYHEFPVMVPRWARSGNETYGRGPGHVALPDVRSMNKAMQFTFDEWGLAIRPPQKALHGGVAGTIKMTPAAITWLYDMQALASWDRGVQFQTNLIERKELAQKIRDAFYSDLTGLWPVQGTPVSAAEFAGRYEIVHRKLGPTIGRGKAELLAPMIDRMFGLMWRANALPPPPPALEGEEQIDVEYEGPLARAQRMNDLVAIERKNAYVAVVQPINPEIMDNWDWDEEARHVSEVTGIPAKLLRDRNRVKSIREIRAKQQVAQEEMAAMQQGADVLARGGRGIKNLAEAAQPQNGRPAA